MASTSGSHLIIDNMISGKHAAVELSDACSTSSSTYRLPFDHFSIQYIEPSDSVILDRRLLLLLLLLLQVRLLLVPL
jgi:hypothetical protein